MRSRKRKHKRKNSNINCTGRRHETVYVASPCENSCNSKINIPCPPPEKPAATPKKPHGGGFKSILNNLLGKSGNDDFLLIVLIAIIFLSRRKTDDIVGSESCKDEAKEFSVTDFLSKASDILKKFNDNDILLIALLYILL